MATPYTALKSAIEALEKAHIELDNAIFLANDRTATIADMRTMLFYLDKIKEAKRDLGTSLSRLQRLNAQPVASQLANQNTGGEKWKTTKLAW